MGGTPTREVFDDYGVLLDDVFSVLGNERRRLVLGYLKSTDKDSVELGDLATSIAGWEHDKPAGEVSYDERKSVQTSLYQLHLPKMDELGFVEFDRRCGTVTLTDLGTELEVSVGADGETRMSSAMSVVLGVSTVFSALVLRSGTFPGPDGGPIIAFGAVACLGIGALLSVGYDRWVSSDRNTVGLPTPDD
ncbi:DUF7344 domain-containing protein [Haloplanus sp.]|uniref:DUF7344 domain-containing protein n=1 Tax=Haloplanus sp. TaxID=1961696 RepID=UPI0026200CBE|nr:hypothetical protein [Haloplanus sp.]